MKNFLYVLAAVLCGIACAWVYRSLSPADDASGSEPSVVRRAGEAERPVESEGDRPVSEVTGSVPAPAEADPPSAESSGAPAPASDAAAGEEEARKVAEEDRLAEAFDELTDSWMEEAADRKVDAAAVADFVQAFRKVPSSRQEEGLRRALNLIPDDNAALLAGILMDASLDKELVEIVFNDMLNRDESVKEPLLKEIFKDRKHPCWADAAWVLDTTGELPQGSR